MIKRSDLETPRTVDEMQELIRSFSKDRTYSNEDIHRRRGIIKTLLEEYQPLSALSSHLNARSAHLTARSHEGPDGIIQLQSNKQLGVQITVADQSSALEFGCKRTSTQEAHTRERLSRGQPTFANTKKLRDRTTGQIVECGRVLTTREARLRGQVQAAVTAIQKKREKFHKGTEGLLVVTRISLHDLGINYSWKQDLKKRVEDLGAIPYKRLYLANGDELIPLIE